MKVITKELKEVDVLKDIVCDSCGKMCNTEYGFEYLKLSANWGFGSSKDLKEWNAHLCENCTDKKLDFIKFKITNYHPL